MRPPSFLSIGPTQQDTAQPKKSSARRLPFLISLVKSSFGSLKSKEMDKKKRGGGTSATGYATQTN